MARPTRPSTGSPPHDGDVDKAIAVHRRLSTSELAGVQGFLTNLGGLVTMAMTVPANISGLALLQCHMVAGIAHLRGYDLADPRVRNAVFACMLGEDASRLLVKKQEAAQQPDGDRHRADVRPDLDDRIATEVADRAHRPGRRQADDRGHRPRVPVIGGGVGAVTDGYATYQVGRYAAKQLKLAARSP